MPSDPSRGPSNSFGSLPEKRSAAPSPALADGAADGPTPGPAHESRGGSVSRDERDALLPQRDPLRAALSRLNPNPAEAKAANDKLKGLETELAGLRRLLSTSNRMSSALGQETLLDTILTEVLPLADAHRGLILLSEGQELRVLHGRNLDGSTISLDEKSLSLTVARKCLEANRLMAFDDFAESADLAQVRSIRVNDLRSAVCVPLVEAGIPFGVLYLDSKRISVLRTDAEKRLLEAFGSQLSVCLVNARLIQKLEESKTLLARENYELRAEVKGERSFAGMIGSSVVMQSLFQRLNLVKDVIAPVLLQGESGTGKEVVAKALHTEGPRSDRAFIAVNCGAIPGELLESELFGHMRGAFTGAITDQAGLVEQADGGTLFLDEIGDMALKSQVALLRFLESGEYRRVGGGTIQFANVRLISATNKDLKAGIEEKWFREDLYFRLNVVCLQLPPLRDRREDIPLLIDHFFHKLLEDFPREIKGIDPAALELMLAYDWPGNVRQLIHAIQGSCAFVPDGEYLTKVQLLLQVTGMEELAQAGANAVTEPRLLHDAVAVAERSCVAASLERNKWNITKSANDLGISRQHLHTRLRHHGLERPRN